MILNYTILIIVRFVHVQKEVTIVKTKKITNNISKQNITLFSNHQAEKNMIK